MKITVVGLGYVGTTNSLILALQKNINSLNTGSMDSIIKKEINTSAIILVKRTVLIEYIDGAKKYSNQTIKFLP